MGFFCQCLSDTYIGGLVWCNTDTLLVTRWLLKSWLYRFVDYSMLIDFLLFFCNFKSQVQRVLKHKILNVTYSVPYIKNVLRFIKERKTDFKIPQPPLHGDAFLYFSSRVVFTENGWRGDACIFIHGRGSEHQLVFTCWGGRIYYECSVIQPCIL